MLFGEPLVETVERVARDELGLEVAAGDVLGYIEYPSHYENGLDSPVGIAFATEVVSGSPAADDLPDGCEWFTSLPDGLYEEQREFLIRRVGLEPRGRRPSISRLGRTPREEQTWRTRDYRAPGLACLEAARLGVAWRRDSAAVDMK